MILQMPHSFRWGDRAGVVISKIPAESVYGRRLHKKQLFLSSVYFYYLHNRVTNANMRII